MSNRRIVTSLVLAVLAAPALVFAQATPIVTLSGTVARGPLSADVFNQRLNASVPAVRACYATALSRAPTLAGVLSLEVSFDAAGGAALFTDLRFGRWNVHARGGWAFPTSWLERPNVSALVALGVRLF